MLAFPRRSVLAGFIGGSILSACDGSGAEQHLTDPAAEPVPLKYAKTFKVWRRDGYHIVDIRGTIVGWGEAAKGEEQRARLVLVPRTLSPPKLSGDLAGATLIRTPLERIAVNYNGHEAMLHALGLAHLLVAVGGTFSYDDGVYNRVRSGELMQVGYGWHSPPMMEAVIGSRPDAFIMALADITHADAIPRIQALGVPVIPTFVDAEPHYLGRTEYVRLIGLLTAHEREAEAFVAGVEAETERLKAAATALPQKSMLWAWNMSGDKWAVTNRNADAQLIRDANLELVMSRSDDPQRDVFDWVSTEALLREGTQADCWVMRDTISRPFENVAVLEQFKAWREDCVFAANGQSKPERNAYEIYEDGVIRPDFLLGDLIKAAYPQVRPEPFRYLRAGRDAVTL